MFPLSTMPNASIPAGFRKKSGDSRSGAGMAFVTPDGKALFLRRKGADHAGEWAFPGGMTEGGEEPADTARREAMEEVGQLADWNVAPLHRETRDDLDFTTFGQPVATAFKPTLNDEHDDYAWADPNDPPRPLHPGVASLLARFFGEEAREKEHSSSSTANNVAEKLRQEFERETLSEDGKALHGAVDYTPVASNPDESCARCKQFDGEHCNKVVDPIVPGGWCRKFDVRPIGATDSVLRLALDRRSVRTFDTDGRMHVSVANISKATVNPYKGEEIPGYEELGLEPEKIYQLLRDPKELAKAAATFNGVQLLKKHTPVDANDHKAWDIVGTTGTDAHFDGTYLTNSLHVWSKEGIDYIESGDQRELSCGYHYVPVMTPGVFDGKHYDGVMTNIEGNHVALVEEGRAGHDVVVGDSALVQKDKDMKPTRLEYIALTRSAAAINPLLAMDAKVEYGPIFRGLNSKNFKQRRPVIMDQLKKAVSGKTIAKDASLEHVANFLDTFEHTPPAHKSWENMDESVSGPQHRAMEAAAHGHSNLGISKETGQEFEKADKGKTFGDMIRDWSMNKDWSNGMSDDDYAALDKMHMDAIPAVFDAEPEGEEVNIEVEEGEDRKRSAKDKKARDAKRAKDKKAKDNDLEQEEGEADDEEIEQEEGEEADDSKDAKDRKAKDRKGAMDKNYVTIDEMNKTVAAVEAKARAAAEARLFVKPYVGEVSLALDTAEKIHRAAAASMGIEDAKTVHYSALPTLIKTVGSAKRREQQALETQNDIAMDSISDSGADSFNRMFPGAARIGQV